MKTAAEYEAEIRDLRERLARAEKVVDRLLAEPPRTEKVTEFVPYPVAPYVPPAPVPNPWIPVGPWWQIGGVCAAAGGGIPQGQVWIGTTNHWDTAGCAANPMLDWHQLTVTSN